MSVLTGRHCALREIEKERIARPGGCRLVARVWLPEGAVSAPVAANLECRPGRKRAGTRARDEAVPCRLLGGSPSRQAARRPAWASRASAAWMIASSSQGYSCPASRAISVSLLS